MRREIFSDEHLEFRQQFQRFVKAEVEPHIGEWNEAGITP
ncbi:MAG: acyl-CoA dehydrogenase family protein, partial [bacterium]|nr:acyl-CoA dehydrogenase family protein [bacterium]MCP4006540.1 acyl-CoA dehydrogenase family protein [bacterium]